MAKKETLRDTGGRFLTWYGEPVPPPPHIEIEAILVQVGDDRTSSGFGLDREGAKQLIESLERTFKL